MRYRDSFNLLRLLINWRMLGHKKVIPNMEQACVQSILRFDVILQHDWPIKQCRLHIRVFFGGKTKRPCFDLFIHWLIKQITNTYRNHFSRSYENRAIPKDVFILLIVQSQGKFSDICATSTTFYRHFKNRHLNVP